MRTYADKMQWLGIVCRHRDVTHAQFRVAYVLVDHFNCKTGQCNPSIATIADAAAVTPRAAQKAIGFLESKGLISVTRQQGGQRKQTNAFIFHIGRENEGSTPEPTFTGESRFTPEPRFAEPLNPGSPRTVEVELAAATRARALGDDISGLLSAMAAAGFHNAEVHAPKPIALLREWVAQGVTAGDVQDVAAMLRERYPGKSFGPMYMQGPMSDHLEAKRNGSSGKDRGAGGKKSAAERFHELNKRIASGLDG